LQACARPRGPRSDQGASLIEALIAAAVVTTIAAGVAHLLAWARHEAWAAGVRSTAAVVAVQKMERLRSLSWQVDADGNIVSDERTNLAEDPPTADGTGMGPSPAGSLEQNVMGFVDYVDGHARWCGTGTHPPACAAYIRRWAIEPVGTDPDHARRLTVLVIPIGESFRERPLRTVRLQTIRVRVSP
jgi:hypothetical protein